MFSPAEYLTNLRQISLINNLVTPRGQLPSIPPIPQLSSTPAAIPVVATVPGVTPSTECNDVISAIAFCPLTIGVATGLAAALILTYLIRKHGQSILAWFRDKKQQFLAAIRNKLLKNRVIGLLPPSQAIVMA